jgi:hypothetical protein
MKNDNMWWWLGGGAVALVGGWWLAMRKGPQQQQGGALDACRYSPFFVAYVQAGVDPTTVDLSNSVVNQYGKRDRSTMPEAEARAEAQSRAGLGSHLDYYIVRRLLAGPASCPKFADHRPVVIR